MPFHKVQPEKLSSSVVRQIELLILRGILRPGERLPSERELSERLGVSRPSLRDAIANLQEQGLLTTRAGSGIFVADVLGSAFSPAMTRLFATHDEALVDYLSFRRDIETLAAERAARVGSDSDLQVIQAVFDRMATTHTPSKDAELDAQFHSAIVEASHNVVMVHMMRSMFDLLHTGMIYYRQVMFKQRTTKAALLAQHAAINSAIQARDPGAARQAIDMHLGYVETSLADQKKSEKNEIVASQRLAHEMAQR